MDINVTVYIPSDDTNVNVSINDGVTVHEVGGGGIASPTRTEWGQNGFVDRSNSTIAFDDGTRTFTITPVGDEFYYYMDGKKYVKTSAESVVIDDEIGIHVVYYNGDTITAEYAPTKADIDSLIRTKCLICILYWNKTDQEAVYVGEERHGYSMSPVTHAYLHFTVGLAYVEGLSPNTMDVDGSGSDNTAGQFGVDAGQVSDEDIYDAISAVGSTTGCPIYYMLGSTPEWNKYTNTGFSVRTFDGTSSTRLAYNQFTGGAWQLTEVGSNDYVLCHLFATTEKDLPMIAVMGQDDYATVVSARAGADTEILSLVTDDLLFPEIKPIATFIFQTASSYSNDIKARIRKTDTGDNFVDWRSSAISQVSAGTSHGDLSGLSADDHTQYALLAGRSGGQTLYGGTDASDDLTLESTSNATKGNVIIPSSDFQMGNTTVDAGTFRIINGARTSDPKFEITLSADDSGHAYLSADTGSLYADIQSAKRFNVLQNGETLGIYNTGTDWFMAVSSGDLSLDVDFNVNADTDTVGGVTASRAKMGMPTGGSSDYAYFGHVDSFGAGTNYALAQGTGGDTFLNASLGSIIRFMINNSAVANIDGNGTLTLLNGEYISNTSNGIVTIGSDNGDSLGFTFNGSDIYQKWSDGDLYLGSSESSSAPNIVRVGGISGTTGYSLIGIGDGSNSDRGSRFS